MTFKQSYPVKRRNNATATGREKSGMTGFELVRHSQAFTLASFNRKEAKPLLNSNLVWSFTELKVIWLLVVCRIVAPFFARKWALSFPSMPQ
ncbi:hypothetical protein TNCV_2360821 [Trichonephila clavipes]|nr:hypothetical protein TNCV_2360821 [Trichonephila clavipes]